MTWMMIATWSTAAPGMKGAADLLARGEIRALDAVELVARSVEDDPAETTVGSGGFPNRDGEIELDAAFMDGRDLSLGAVAGVKGYPNPVSIARRLMTDSAHTFLVGEGADAFAASKGFARGILINDAIRKAWEERAKQMESVPESVPDTSSGHDTVGVVALDGSGDMAVATSTSGMAMKLPGRVGDSPLVGSGYYVDNEVGGAAATGLGEDIMKGCTCFLAVELMRQGRTPMQAAQEAIRRTHDRLARTGATVGNMALVCANRMGDHGSAANHDGFTYTIASSEKAVEVVAVERLT